MNDSLLTLLFLEYAPRKAVQSYLGFAAAPKQPVLSVLEKEYKAQKAGKRRVGNVVSNGIVIIFAESFTSQNILQTKGMVDDELKHGRLDTESNQENRPSDNSIGKTKWFKWFLGAIVFVVVSIVVFLLVMKGLPWEMEKRGQLGDMFGVIGAFFSGLAFAGVVVTMLQQNEDLNLQRKELILQRKEIEQTNRELEQQRDVMKEQNKTIMLQRFENTFFSMLEMLQKIVADLKYESEVSGEYKGRDVFDRMYKNFYDYAFSDNKGHKYKHLTRDSPIDAFMECYGFVLSSGQLRYFDHIYRTIKYVHTAQCIGFQEKYNYMCILRAQLSKPELLMLFYFSLYEKSHRLKELMEEYAFFKHIRNNRFVIVAGKDKVLLESHYKQFAPSAYELEAKEYPFDSNDCQS